MRATFLLVLLLLSPGGPPDVSGKWRGVVDVKTSAGESNEVKVVAEFAHEASRVSGWLGPSAEQRFTIAEGAFEGTLLTFQAAMPTRVYTFRLKLLDDDHLEGECQSRDQKAFGKVALSREK